MGKMEACVVVVVGSDRLGFILNVLEGFVLLCGREDGEVVDARFG